MLCSTCESFVHDIIHQDFNTWKRSKPEDPNWVTKKIGNHEQVCLAAKEGCRLCGLFNSLRDGSISGYDTLGQKWHSRPASIDYDMKQGDNSSEFTRWTFHLLTIAPVMSSIQLEFFKATNEQLFAKGHMDGKIDMPFAISDRPDSPRTIEIIQYWMKGCLQGSTEDARANLPAMPTRVIDVGDPDGSIAPRLYISHGQLSHYLTLSHCWGTADRLTLTHNSLESFQNEIPFELLAKTFQDAIRMTRLLGQRYIWIDVSSLCSLKISETLVCCLEMS